MSLGTATFPERFCSAPRCTGGATSRRVALWSAAATLAKKVVLAAAPRASTRASCVDGGGGGGGAQMVNDWMAMH